MHKKLTITLDEHVYNALYSAVGQGKISQYIEDMLRPHVMRQELLKAYQAMADDEAREEEALEWSENLIGDVLNETR